MSDLPIFIVNYSVRTTFILTSSSRDASPSYRRVPTQCLWNHQYPLMMPFPIISIRNREIQYLLVKQQGPARTGQAPTTTNFHVEAPIRVV